MTFEVLTLTISSLASHQTWSNCHLHYYLSLREDLDLDYTIVTVDTTHSSWGVNTNLELLHLWRQHQSVSIVLRGKMVSTKTRHNSYLIGVGILQSLNIWIKDVLSQPLALLGHSQGHHLPPHIYICKAQCPTLRSFVHL